MRANYTRNAFFNTARFAFVLRQCAHVDACKSGEDDCIGNLYGKLNTKATCNHDSSSSVGSPKHTRTCSKGFEGDGTKSGSGCSDINACSTNRCPTSVQPQPRVLFFAVRTLNATCQYQVTLSLW